MNTHPPIARNNLYAVVHKALRAQMADALTTLGRTDWEDAADRGHATATLRALLDFCRGHLQHENDFLHAAMDARRPGSAAHTATEHRAHLRDIAELEALAQAIELTPDRPCRAAAASRLYRQLARFVAENYEHMEIEESANNAVLWDCYSDAELDVIHEQLVASIPPAEMMHALRWMLPFASHGERLEMLTGMRAQAPAEVFGGVIAMVQPLLRERDWQKLESELALASCG